MGVVLLEGLDCQTKSLRISILTEYTNNFLGQTIFPLPIQPSKPKPNREKREEKKRGERERGRLEFQTLSFGLKVGVLKIRIQPLIQTHEKEVFFELMDSLPHGYLGFNRVEGECTKATQAAIKALKFGCKMGEAPVPPLHNTSSQNPSEKDEDENKRDLILPETECVIIDFVEEKELKVGDIVQVLTISKNGMKATIKHKWTQKGPFTLPLSSLAPHNQFCSLQKKDKEEQFNSRDIEREREKRYWNFERERGKGREKERGKERERKKVPQLVPVADGKKQKLKLNICVVGPRESGRRELFLSSSLKQAIENSEGYDPKIRTTKGFEALEKFGFLVYTLYDCPFSLEADPSSVEEEEKENDKREDKEKDRPLSPSLLSLKTIEEDLRQADIIVLCLSLFSGASSLSRYKSLLIPKLKNISNSPLILVGTEKEKRDFFSLPLSPPPTSSSSSSSSSSSLSSSNKLPFSPPSLSPPLRSTTYSYSSSTSETKPLPETTKETKPLPPASLSPLSSPLSPPSSLPSPPSNNLASSPSRPFSSPRTLSHPPSPSLSRPLSSSPFISNRPPSPSLSPPPNYAPPPLPTSLSPSLSPLSSPTSPSPPPLFFPQDKKKGKRETISREEGKNFSIEMGMAGYVEVSVHSFSGFRTLANASLAAVFGAWVKTPDGPAMVDKLSKNLEKGSSILSEKEKCSIM